MVQVKKEEIRQAILDGAFSAFSRKGYAATSVAEIAESAGITVANVYVYFPSKLLILYEIYTPWLTEQLVKLRASVAHYRSPQRRLKRIFIGLWSDIPAADHCFANSLMEAMALAPAAQGKPTNLLSWSEAVLTEMIVDSLPEDRRHLASNHLLSHILWMAFDGFAMNYRIGDTRDIEALSNLMVEMLLGPNAIVEAPDAASSVAEAAPKKGRSKSRAVPALDQ